MSLVLFLAAAAAGQSFSCTPTQIVDANAPILCADGQKVRLAGIAARPIEGACAAGEACPEKSGEAARDRLALALGGATATLPNGRIAVAGAPMQCTLVAKSSAYTLAACSAGKTDLGCMMVYEGYAVSRADLGGARRCSAVL